MYDHKKIYDLFNFSILYNFSSPLPSHAVLSPGKCKQFKILDIKCIILASKSRPATHTVLILFPRLNVNTEWKSDAEDSYRRYNILW